MEQTAMVMSVENKKARVQIRRVSACGDNCASCKGGCTPTNTYVDALNLAGAKPGQYIKIEMKTSTFFSSVLLNYGLPLVALIIGIAAGSIYFPKLNLSISSELLAFASGFLMMGLAYVGVSIIDRRYAKTKKVVFEITKIL